MGSLRPNRILGVNWGQKSVEFRSYFVCSLHPSRKVPIEVNCSPPCWRQLGWWLFLLCTNKRFFRNFKDAYKSLSKPLISPHPRTGQTTTAASFLACWSLFADQKLLSKHQTCSGQLLPLQRFWRRFTLTPCTQPQHDTGEAGSMKA